MNYALIAQIYYCTFDFNDSFYRSVVIYAFAYIYLDGCV